MVIFSMFCFKNLKRFCPQREREREGKKRESCEFYLVSGATKRVTFGKDREKSRQSFTK